MHLTDRCRFLNFSVRMGRGGGVWTGGIRYEFTTYFWGFGGGAVRYGSGFPPHPNPYVPPHINNRYINS